MATTTDVIGWLSEVGVPDADLDTLISSLNLTWLIHRYEESTGRAAHLTDGQLAGATTVREFVDLLDGITRDPPP